MTTTQPDPPAPIARARDQLTRKIPSILRPVAEFVAREAFRSIDRHELADVMDEHYFTGVRDARWECSCGAALGRDADDVQDAHSRHQADAILAWLTGGEPRG